MSSTPIKNVISLSGGKDSTALLLEAVRRGVEFEAVFADTGHENPITYEYIGYLSMMLDIRIRWVKADFSEQIARKRNYVATRWLSFGVRSDIIHRALAVLHPTGVPFLDLCLWKGRFPSTSRRFCSSELKHEPIFFQALDPLLGAGHKVFSWQGVRADESLARSGLASLEHVGGGFTTTGLSCGGMSRPYLRHIDISGLSQIHSTKWGPAEWDAVLAFMHENSKFAKWLAAFQKRSKGFLNGNAWCRWQASAGSHHSFLWIRHRARTKKISASLSPALKKLWCGATPPKVGKFLKRN